jgi:hypothetical protein
MSRGSSQELGLVCSIVELYGPFFLSHLGALKPSVLICSKASSTPEIYVVGRRNSPQFNIPKMLSRWDQKGPNASGSSFRQDKRVPGEMMYLVAFHCIMWVCFAGLQRVYRRA